MNKIDVREYLQKDPEDAYVDKLLAALKEDREVYAEIKRLGLTVAMTRENAAKLTDFKESVEYCRNCPGVDACAKKMPRLRAYLTLEGKHLSLQYTPCDRMLERLRLDSMYLYDDFPKAWRSAEVSALDLSENRRPLIREFLKIMEGKSHRWLYLLGNHGVGKSYILVAFANAFAIKDRGRVAVIDCRRRFEEFVDLSYHQRKEFAKVTDELMAVPLLILRDFGSEYKNDYVRDRIVLPLLEERARRALPTFFTSEFSFTEIEELYSVGKGAGRIMARRLFDLLRENALKEFDLTGAALYRQDIS